MIYKFSAILTTLFALTTFNGCTKERSSLVVPTKHNKNLTLGQIAEMMPGMGMVMMEYSHRFYVAYYAARAGNWDLAEYELEEMLEIQEVGEATRPEYAQALKAFEENYLNQVIEQTKSKNWNGFQKVYQKAITGCNACHAGTGHGYIRYRLPVTPPALPVLSLKE